MVLVRALLIVLVTLSASLSGAMETGHMLTTEHDHAAAGSMADDGLACCDDGIERGQSCHVLPALLSDAGDPGAAPSTGEEVFITSDLHLTGIELSGPLDPPRLV